MTEQQNPQQPDPKAERTAALRAAYQEATNQLRAENQPRFNELYAKAAENRGQKWEPKKTKEQRDEEELQRILSENPGLRERIAPAQAPDAPTE